MTSIDFRAHRCLSSGIAGALAKPVIPPSRDADAVYALIERLLPGASSYFALSLSELPDGTKPHFVLEGGATVSVEGGDKITISATGGAELAAGVGYYLREVANATIGWPRGGGSHVPSPSTWPKVSATVKHERAAPISYIMNVCTHSYSLVWYSWKEWEAFIDWMALSGINMFLALTGQEELQLKVFEQFGLSESEIRSWFNGPAFLTWSRGQNECSRRWHSHQRFGITPARRRPSSCWSASVSSGVIEFRPLR